MTADLVQQALDDFWETIPGYWHEVRAQIRQSVVESGLISVEQFHILRHIRQGKDSVSQIAQVKRISRPAISQAVQALVEKGLVERQRNPADRRQIKLSLSPAGEELLKTVFDTTNSWIKHTFKAFSDRDLKAFSRGMAALKKSQVS